MPTSSGSAWQQSWVCLVSAVRNLSTFHPTLHDSNCWRRCCTLPGSAHPQLCLAVYLYGAAARDESRKALPSIRAGEYEALPEKVSLVVAQGGQT